MKLIPQERLDAAKGCTKGPWKFGVWDWQLSKSDFIERPLDYTGPGYYGNPSIYDADGKEVAGCDEYYVFSTPENVAAMLLAPELLAENEMLRALLTEAMNVNADITTHAHHLHNTGLLWRAEKIKELADALSNKLDEVLP